jgi:hypothetical protein
VPVLVVDVTAREQSAAVRKRAATGSFAVNTSTPAKKRFE